MKVTTIIPTVFALVAGVLPTVEARTDCYYTNASFFIAYGIDAENVKDMPGVCGRFWDNLRRFGACTVTSPTCGAGGQYGFHLAFSVPVGCNTGMVSSAWWEATHNEFGGISCRNWIPS